MKHYLGYSFAVAALVAAFYLWHKSELAVARAEERAAAQQQIAKNAQETITKIERDRQEAVVALEAERKKPATVQTVTKFLPAPLPAGSEVKIEQLPDAPKPQLVVTGDAQANLQAIQNMEIAHLECEKNLLSCRDIVTQKDSVIAAVSKERDTWKETAKGGSKTHRFVRTLKVIGCAGGGAALGSVIGKTRGAAIGGAVGGGTCSVFF
jgi:hypothetical protein